MYTSLNIIPKNNSLVRLKVLFVFIFIGFSYSTSIGQAGKLKRTGTHKSINPINNNSAPKKDKVKEDTPEKKGTVCDCNQDLEYDRDRDIAYFRNHPDQPPYTGTCITFYPNPPDTVMKKRLQIKATYVDGKEHGTTYKFYKNGALNVEINNTMGTPDGEWKFYAKDSTLRWSKNYVMGKLNGEQKWFYENGALKRLETFKMGIKDGLSKKYYEDSAIKKEVTYLEDKFHGAYKKYANDSNNTLIIERNYHKGELDGNCNYYYESGEVGYKKHYKKGKPDGTWNFYYENGNEKAIEVYKNGKKIGVWRSYHSNQKLKSEIIYKKDEVVSKREYDRFGREL